MEPIRKAYYIILTLSLVLSLLKYNRLDRTLRVLPFLIGLGLITQIIDEYYRFVGERNTIVFHLFEFPENILYGIYFYYLFESKKLKFSVVLSVLLVLSLFFYFIQKISVRSEPFGIIESVQALFMVVFSVVFYYNLLQKDGYTNLIKFPHFYINSANLIHFTISFIYYSFYSYFKNAQEISDLLKLIPQCTNILMYLLYSFAFICQRT